MPKPDTIKAGDVLYQVTRRRMGNTMMTEECVYEVRVIEKLQNGAMVSWNGNRPQFYDNRNLASLRRSKPTPKPSIWDRARGEVDRG